MDLTSSSELDRLFGPGSRGRDPEQRARTSSQVFVRSQDHLARLSPSSTGRRLSAWEVFHAFGMDVIREVAEYGSAILPKTADEPAATIRTRREALGLTKENLSKASRVHLSVVEDAENPHTRTPIRDLEKIAQALGLDDRTISFVPQAGGDQGLAVRLRELSSSPQAFSPRLISQFCEAAWVFKKQYELKRWLGIGGYGVAKEWPFQPSSQYEGAGYRAWEYGYYLAQRTRDILGIPAEQPIESLRELIEEGLGIAIVQFELPKSIAGATVANGSERGIAVNVLGDNENVWVRRATLAHELEHLLWDPEEKLRHLVVDRYKDLAKEPRQQSRPVEARANAFAVEFLAPQRTAVEVFLSAESSSQGLRAVMEKFGISFTSARYHIQNKLDRKFPVEDLTVDDNWPSDDWTGRESFTVDYFRPKSVPISRRGYFAYYIVEAVSRNLITAETAATYLACTLDEYNDNASRIREIFSGESASLGLPVP